MAYKSWVKGFFSIVFFAIALFALFNYTIDPLWTFCHSNRFNNAQPGFNERQQKTNRAYFCGLKQYNALLLGSSRTTYINQHDFKGMNVYNYASVSMYPSEYNGWIELAKKIKGKDFDTIILGVDFFGSNDGAFGKQQMEQAPKPSYYFNITTSFLYRYKMLFSMDTFKKSIESIKHSFSLGTIDYTRDNVKQTIRISKARKQIAVNRQINLHANVVYGKSYHYNQELKNYFVRLKKSNPHTKFIIFTTPISADLFRLLVKSGNLKDYNQWITMLVETFGKIYDFMGINTITNNPSNYADLHHFYPNIGKFIVDRFTGINNKNIPKNFGILVNKHNLKQHLQSIREKVQNM